MECKFEDILKEGIERALHEYGIRGLNEATPMQRGKALTEFYLKEIGQYLYNIFEDDIQEGICDGKNDLGVDFVYKKDNGEWFIVQSKYKGHNSTLTPDEVAGFFQSYLRISDPDYLQKHGSNKLKEVLVDLTPTDSFHLALITNDKVSTRIEEEFEKLKKGYEDNEKLCFELKSFTDLKRDYKCVLSEAEGLTDEVKITIETLLDTFSNEKRQSYFDLTSAIANNNGYKSMLCTIKGTTLKGLWQKDKSKIFNYNIRGYLGENAINKKMRDTLDKEPDKFYFYNNGISAICTNIIPEMDENGVRAFICKNFSIINGAQTTSVIGRYKKVNNLKDVLILLRITKAEEYKKEKGLNKNIITYNNSQSIIKLSDFRANDDIQILLEKQLPQFLYKAETPFRRVVYLRKRIKVNKLKGYLYVSLESLARALYVFDYGPLLMYKSSRELFDVDPTNGKYWLIFGYDNKETDLYDNKRLERLASIYFIYTRIEENVAMSIKYSTSDKEAIKYKALFAKWHFLWAYGYLINLFYSDTADTIHKKVANGKIFEGKNFIDRWFPKIHNTIAKCIERNYDASRNATGEMKSFNYKNWLRNNSDFDEFIREFKYMEKSEFPIEPPGSKFNLFAFALVG